MSIFLILLSSWTIGIIISILVLFTYASLGNELLADTVTFKKEALIDHDVQVAAYAIKEFMHTRAEAIHKRKQEVSQQQKDYIAQINSN